MPDLNLIKSLSVRAQTTEQNIRREYIQHIFLSYLYQHTQAKNLFFKGGTALRLIFNSPRFSEDLDFDSQGINLAGAENIILDTLKEIEREGWITQILESKETTGGYLALMKFSQGSESINLEINISFRKKRILGETITVICDYIPPYTTIILAQELLVKEKFEALFDRKKPRDFYDLYYMLRKGMVLVEDRNQLKLVSDILKKADINFEVELKSFLPKSHWAVIKDFTVILDREISRFL
ncbi:nucleotidyl transferase AbiEii/AbiGii toxin family protein [Candidatus Amesbacteria bacterium]|nr:nucleotidyl transferase AbiEii/AbiGii toxin family protein [Candidatus Amesbacteria bacterium]